RPVGALNTTAGAVVTLTNSSACDVFWTPSAATTLGANTNFSGTVIDDSCVTVGANSTWVGRALAFCGTVTIDTDTISAPSCSPIIPVVVAPASPTPSTTSQARREANMATQNIAGHVLGVSTTTTATPTLPSTGKQTDSKAIFVLFGISLALFAIGFNLKNKVVS